MALLQLSFDEPDYRTRWPKEGSDLYVAAICPHCGGWTMYCAADGSHARAWAALAQKAGEWIVFWRNANSLGPACWSVINSERCEAAYAP